MWSGIRREGLRSGELMELGCKWEPWEEGAGAETTLGAVGVREEGIESRNLGEPHVWEKELEMKVRAIIKVGEEPGQCNDREVGIESKILMAPSSVLFALKPEDYFQQALWPQGGKWG